jgi:hypothetical protein
MFDIDKAKFIGEGPWEKDAANQVYELDGKYYVITVVGHRNKEIIDEMTFEIPKEEIGQYCYL